MTYITATRPFKNSSTRLWDIDWMTYKTDEDMRELTRLRRIGIRFQYY